jgi:4-amino-4-deoxy-L-arabinose transferase-like glycosyltransferase
VTSSPTGPSRRTWLAVIAGYLVVIAVIVALNQVRRPDFAVVALRVLLLWPAMAYFPVVRARFIRRYGRDQVDYPWSWIYGLAAGVMLLAIGTNTVVPPRPEYVSVLNATALAIGCLLLIASTVLALRQRARRSGLT